MARCRILVRRWLIVVVVASASFAPVAQAQSRPKVEFEFGAWSPQASGSHVKLDAIEIGATGWMTTSFGVTVGGLFGVGNRFRMAKPVVVINRFSVRGDFKIDVGVGWIRFFNRHPLNSYNTAVAEFLVGRRLAGRFGAKAGFGIVPRGDDSFHFLKLVGTVSF